MLATSAITASPEPTASVRNATPLAAANDNSHIYLVHDTLNNLTSELLSVDGGAKTFDMAYAYDADGYMTSRSLPSGRVLAVTSDGLGRMTKIKQSTPASDQGSGGGGKGGSGQEGPDPYQTYAENISYHPNGAIAAMDYGNGQAFTQTLTARLQPLRMLSQHGSSIALDLTYSYNALGKVIDIDSALSGDDRTYGYDDIGRLTSATGPWGSAAYKYDSLGNILEKQVGARTIEMTYNYINRLVSHVDLDGNDDPIPGTERTLSYDNRGNITWLGAQRFRYDASDQPYEILGTVVGDYVYDGNMKRVKSVVAGKTIYNVYDASGTLVHVDEDTDGKYTDYIPASAGMSGAIARVTNGGWATWLHMDTLGSANTGTNMWGMVDWREQYTPYGQTLTNPLSNDDQAGFTGHIKDSATGLNYMQARYYDPVIGRFLSIDPVNFTVDQPQMFNRFSYVSNDPINAWDPHGEHMEELAEAYIRAGKGAWKSIRGYTALMRYHTGFMSKNPGPHNQRDFIHAGIKAGVNFAAQNPEVALQMGVDAIADKGLAYNAGKFATGAAVTAPLAPEAMAGKAALGAANFSLTVTGSMMDSLYSAYGELSSSDISPNRLSNDIMGKIGAVAINEGKFSYNSDTNVLTGSWTYQDANGNEATRSIDIPIRETRPQCTGSRICD